MRKLQLLLLLLFSSSIVLAQERAITGTVSENTGSPLPGVNVIVKGTSIGTVTDVEGKYALSVDQSASILLFSSVGFVSEEIVIENQSVINVTLNEDITALGEIVVVGYGTQKKINMTGSVSTIKNEEIAKQPVFQTSQALAGLAPGLVATQSSGQPGSDNATLRIRGLGTLGTARKNNPLILVDGIPDDIDGVDPNDIENVSILKDAAAAAIYGSRAANGVILITTKRGKSGDVRVNYSNYFGVQRVTQNLKYLDGLGYIENVNKATPGTYDDAFIANYAATRGTDESPDTDWVNDVFSENGFQQYHRFSVNGGSEMAKVAASISFMDQNGNIPNFDFKRYNGRFNTDLKISKKFDINFDLNFRRSIQNEAAAGLNLITRQAYRVPPLFSAINSDGTWGPGWGGQNPVASSRAGGIKENRINYFRGLLKANYRPVDGLVLSVMFAPQYNDYFSKRFTAQYEWQDLSESGIYPNQNSLFQVNERSFQNNFNAIINYSKDFNDHYIGATLGYEILKNDFSWFDASRKNYVLQEFQQLSLGDADTQLNRGNETQNGLESFFGRVNYSYKNKYLFEANIRRDASSRFAPENRVSIFPAFSFGWRVAEEAFLSSSNVISDLKLRASWGQLGNQQIAGNFPYQSTFQVGIANPIIGGVPITGGAQTILANRNLQWETTETLNFAVDVSFLENRLALTGEYYIRTTSDILLNATVPTSLGLAPPVQNVGSVENKGFDLDINWNDDIGDFKYGINFNISDYINTVTELGGLTELPPGGEIIRVGESMGSIYGLEVVGLFGDQAEIDGAPVQQFGPVEPGDVRYKDQLTIDNNGDGIPDEADGIVNNDDRVIIGNSLPRVNWGLNLTASFRNFDFSASFIGVGKRQIILSGDVAYAFFNAGKIQEWQQDSWTPDNTDASYPRLTPGSSHNNWRTSEQWLFDVSYFRFRNITLGYTFSQDLFGKSGIRNLRLYVSGQNLFTSDNLPEGIDPTVPNFTYGAFYPITSVYTAGLSVNF